MAKTKAVELVCFSGPLDGRLASILGTMLGDGQGGFYHKMNFHCAGKLCTVLVHETVPTSKINTATICQAIRSAQG